jgi:hypothetical protein
MDPVPVAIPVPSRYPEIQEDGAIGELLRRQVDSQFRDLATLLQLPKPELGLDGGGNLTAAGLVCNIISGASVLFFEASVAAVKGTRNASNTLRSGERFRLTLMCHLPWIFMGKLPREDVVKLLWTYTRNPLAHSLGAGKSGRIRGFKGRDVIMAKPVVGLPTAYVAQLMAGDEDPPAGSSEVVALEGRQYIVRIPEFAWAVCRMTRHLLRDPQQLPKTEALAQQIAWGLHDPNPPGPGAATPKASSVGVASSGIWPPDAAR